MKAKKYLTLVLAIGLIVLSACGANAGTNENREETNNTTTNDTKPGSDEDQKDEDGDYEPGDENIEDESKDFDTLAEEGFGIGFIPHGCDAEYFKPATEDYILTIEQTIVRENAIPAISQTGDLYSFDENGNCVQHVSRHRPDHEFDELTDFDIEHLTSLDYRSYEQQVLDDDYNDEAFGGKAEIIRLCLLRKDNNPDFAFYVSKPLESSQTKTSLGADPSEFWFSGYEELIVQTRAGEDYYVSRDEGSNTESIRSVEIGQTDHGNIYQDVRAYHDFHYYNYVISSFDERGNVSGAVVLYVFDEESMVEDFLKSQYGIYYDKTEPVPGVADASLPPDFKLEDTGWHRHDNILYKELTSVSDERAKWDRNAYSEGENLTYFSMEYLTAGQIEAMGVREGVNK